ncbi:MAG: hypothetical protein ACTSQZ_00880 [Candidatus Thorarchaeota archaeon]
MSVGRIQDTQLSPRDVTTIMSVLILLLPWGLSVSQTSTVIFGIFWSLVFRPTNFYFSVNLPADVFPLSVLFIRIIFGVLVSRLYCERGTLKRVLSVGVLAEYPVVFIAILGGALVYSQPAWSYVMIGIPTPFLLLGTLYLLKRRPPPRYDDSWIFTSDKENLESVGSPNPNQNGS